MSNDRVQYGLPGAYEPTPEETEQAMKHGERERTQVFGDLALSIGRWLARVDEARNGDFVRLPVRRVRPA